MKVAFDSHMIPTKDLESAVGLGALRLLETTTRLILPTGALIEYLVTSRDVIHS